MAFSFCCIGKEGVGRNRLLPPICDQLKVQFKFSQPLTVAEIFLSLTCTEILQRKHNHIMSTEIHGKQNENIDFDL